MKIVCTKTGTVVVTDAPTTAARLRSAASHVTGCDDCGSGLDDVIRDHGSMISKLMSDFGISREMATAVPDAKRLVAFVFKSYRQDRVTQ